MHCFSSCIDCEPASAWLAGSAAHVSRRISRHFVHLLARRQHIRVAVIRSQPRADIWTWSTPSSYTPGTYGGLRTVAVKRHISADLLLWLLLHLWPHAGSGVERIDPLHSLAGCRIEWLNRVLCVLSLSTGFFECLRFIGATFLYIISLRLYMFCLMVVLVKLSVYLPSDWLERLLRKPFRLFVIWRLSPQSPGWWALMTFSV